MNGQESDMFGFPRDRRRRLEWYAALAQGGAGVTGVAVDPTIFTMPEQSASGTDWDQELLRLLDPERYT
jgi:hypothetical protein